jgi:hypothetical protein
MTAASVTTQQVKVLRDQTGMQDDAADAVEVA